MRSSQFRLGWRCREFSWPCLCTTILGSQSYTAMPSFLSECWWFELRFSYLQSKCSYLLGHHSNPQVSNICICFIWQKYYITVYYYDSLKNSTPVLWNQPPYNRPYKPESQLLFCGSSKCNETMKWVLTIQVYFKVFHVYSGYIMTSAKH